MNDMNDMNGQLNLKNLDIKYAVDWVTRNKDSIKSKSFRASMISPYDTDDFVQAAYCVAMKVVGDFPRDRKNFKKHFYRAFWSELKEMISRSVPTYVCDEEIRDSLRILSREIELENKQDEIKDEIEDDAGAQDTVQIMAPRQMEVWQELIDYGCYTSRDVTGTTHRAARAAKCMGIRHACGGEEHYRQVRVTGEAA